MLFNYSLQNCKLYVVKAVMNLRSIKNRKSLNMGGGLDFNLYKF